jgi:hypothetical protein
MLLPLLLLLPVLLPLLQLLPPPLLLLLPPLLLPLLLLLLLLLLLPPLLLPPLLLLLLLLPPPLLLLPTRILHTLPPAMRCRPLTAPVSLTYCPTSSPSPSAPFMKVTSRSSQKQQHPPEHVSRQKQQHVRHIMQDMAVNCRLQIVGGQPLMVH